MGENTDTDLFHGSYPFPPAAAPPAMFSMMHYARFPHRVQAPAEVLPAESDPCVNGFCDFYEFSFSRCGKPWASYRSYGFSSRFLLTAAISCAKLFASKQKGRGIAVTGFFHMFHSASAQAACAAFSCPDTTNMMLIPDAGLLLASFLILPAILLVHRFAAEFPRITVQRTHSSPALQAA